MIKTIEDKDVLGVMRTRKVYKLQQREQVSKDISKAITENVQYFELENDIYDYKHLAPLVKERCMVLLKGKVEQIIKRNSYKSERFDNINYNNFFDYFITVTTRTSKADKRKHVYVKWYFDELETVLNAIENNDFEKTRKHLNISENKCFIPRRFITDFNSSPCSEEESCLAILLEIFDKKEVMDYYLSKAQLYIDEVINTSYYNFIHSNKELKFYYLPLFKNNNRVKLQVYYKKVVDDNHILIECNNKEENIQVDTKYFDCSNDYFNSQINLAEIIHTIINSNGKYSLNWIYSDTKLYQNLKENGYINE